MSLADLKLRATANAPTASATMKIRRVSPMNMTLAEIKELLDANPNHPQTADLRRFYDEHATLLDPQTVVAVEKAVVLAILDGTRAVEKTVGISPDGREIIETVIEED